MPSPIAVPFTSQLWATSEDLSGFCSLPLLLPCQLPLVVMGEVQGQGHVWGLKARAEAICCLILKVRSPSNGFYPTRVAIGQGRVKVTFAISRQGQRQFVVLSSTRKQMGLMGGIYTALWSEIQSLLSQSMILDVLPSDQGVGVGISIHTISS